MPLSRPPTPSPDRGTGSVWYRRIERLGTGRWLAEAWESADHPDGTILEATASAPAGSLVWRTRAAESGLLRIEVPADRIPQAPPLWFVDVDEPRARPVASNLVAFSTDDFPAGTVVSRYAFATLGVHNDAQAGAVRWYRDGRVHQLFVAEPFRRRNVGTALLHAADAWHQANGWPGRLHADGRRTMLGQLFLAALRHPQRFAPLSEVMPPMDAAPATEP